MVELPDLKQLTYEAKDALILALWEELQKLQRKRPKETSKNSSFPPAKQQFQIQILTSGEGNQENQKTCQREA